MQMASKSGAGQLKTILRRSRVMKMDKVDDRNLEWAKLVVGRFDERRRYEWKINFAVWSAIALVTGASSLVRE